MHERLIESIRSRKGRSGVLTADRYFRSIEGCFEGGFCPTKLFKEASPEQWAKALKEAENRFTYAGPLKINRKSLKTGAEVGPGMLMTFDCVITTPKRDRDKDILDTAGASLDKAAPLLWQHIPIQPLGPQLAQSKSPSALRGKFGIADTELGLDAAKLVEAGALRISHGFDPEEYEPIDDGEGWHFKKFEVYEVSLVSIPSNTDAVITAYSRGTLKNEAVRAWAKKAFDERKPQGVGLGTVEVSVEVKERACTCHEKAVVPYKPTTKADQGEAWDADSAVSSLRSWAKGSDSELDLTKSDHRDRYKQGFTVVTGDGTNLGDYHLPHHKVASGSLEVVFRGVAAAMGALHGARGGTSLSSTDEAGAKAHLAKHYEQFGEKPPEKSMDPGMGMCKACGHKAPMSEFMTPEEPDADIGTDDDEDMGMPKSFDELRMEIVRRSFDTEPAEIGHLVLQLRGVLDLAEARQEDRKWQEVSESLGLE
ncbi:MAG TPA: HK97 family phage prohead protease [Planctomycetaceae bacterium]|nr:HK97 family phage prohead protease [Planctomycetaceae bacterium]